MFKLLEFGNVKQTKIIADRSGVSKGKYFLYIRKLFDHKITFVNSQHTPIHLKGYRNQFEIILL